MSIQSRLRKLEEQHPQKKPIVIESKVLREYFSIKDDEEFICMPSNIDFEREVLPGIKAIIGNSEGRY